MEDVVNCSLLMLLVLVRHGSSLKFYANFLIAKVFGRRESLVD